MSKSQLMRNLAKKACFITAAELLTHKMPPRRDCHIHTRYTDGKASVLQVLEKAVEQGLEMIVFTEHTESWRAADAGWFNRYMQEIKTCRETYRDKIEAFIGIEADAVSFDGDIEITAQMKENAEFILGAVHRYPGLGERKVQDLSQTEAIDLEYRASMGLAAAKEIDAIAHIGATCSKYCAPFPMNLTRKIIKEATKYGVAVEINPIYHQPLLPFLEMCAEENAMLTLGSNAHGINDIGLIVRELKRILS